MEFEWKMGKHAYEGKENDYEPQVRCSSLAGSDIKFMPAHSFHIPSSYMLGGGGKNGYTFLYSMTDANEK